jgi:photosystem II stability/assembly factor-like uncharacterized protein
MNKKFITLIGFFIFTFILGGASCIQTKGSGSTAMGMFRSDDKGENWKAISAVPTAKGVQSLAGVKVYRIFTDPSDPDALYVGTRGQGMYFTYDRGESWQEVEQLRGKFIHGVAVDPKNKCTIYVTDENNIYKTTDCTRTWVLVYQQPIPSEKIIGLAIDYGNSQTLYAAARGGDVLVSTDGGTSWRAIKRLPFQIEYLASDPLTPRRIYIAGYEDGLVRSDDGGVTWKDLRQPLEKFTDAKKFYRLVIHPTKVNSVFWVSKYGILRSNDAGASWQDIKLNTAPGSVNIYTFGINPLNENELYYTGTSFGENSTPLRSTFYKSVNGGQTWSTKKLPSNTIPVAAYVHPKSPETIFMGFTLVD